MVVSRLVDAFKNVCTPWAVSVPINISKFGHARSCGDAFYRRDRGGAIIYDSMPRDGTWEEESSPILRLICHLIDDAASNRLIRHALMKLSNSYFRRGVKLPYIIYWYLPRETYVFFSILPVKGTRESVFTSFHLAVITSEKSCALPWRCRCQHNCLKYLWAHCTNSFFMIRYSRQFLKISCCSGINHTYVHAF